MRAEIWRRVGKGGQKEARNWEKAAQNDGFFPDKGMVSRLFPAFPTFSHINFF